MWVRVLSILTSGGSSCGLFIFFFSSRRRHTRFDCDWSSDVCSSDLALDQAKAQAQRDAAALDYAHSNLDRGSTLAKSGYLAKDTFDQRASAAQQAEIGRASCRERV